VAARDEGDDEGPAPPFDQWSNTGQMHSQCTVTAGLRGLIPPPIQVKTSSGMGLVIPPPIDTDFAQTGSRARACGGGREGHPRGSSVTLCAAPWRAGLARCTGSGNRAPEVPRRRLGRAGRPRPLPRASPPREGGGGGGGSARVSASVSLDPFRASPRLSPVTPQASPLACPGRPRTSPPSSPPPPPRSRRPPACRPPPTHRRRRPPPRGAARSPPPAAGAANGGEGGEMIRPTSGG
jgi:hypothetical protein